METDTKTKSLKNGHDFRRKMENTVFFKYTPSDSSITRKDFEAFFSDIGPVKKCSLIRSKKDNDGSSEGKSSQRHAKGFGFCKFTTLEDAQLAANQLNNSVMNLAYGLKVRVTVEEATEDGASKHNKSKDIKKEAVGSEEVPEGTPTDNATQTTEELYLSSKKKTSRVIIRNLSFYASEYHIRQTMGQFGDIIDVNVPLVPSIGENAKAGEKKQKKQHRGFAFVTFANPQAAHKVVQSCSEKEIIIKKRPVAVDFSVAKMQHNRIKAEEAAAHKNEVKDENSNSENDSTTDSESDSGSEEDDSDGEDDDVNINNSEDDEGESASETEDAEDTEAPKPDSHKNSLFLRNLPFDTTRQDLFLLFKQFGYVDGIFLVKDKDSGICKGTAFIKFEKEGACVRALKACKSSNSDDSDNRFQSGKEISAISNGNGGLYLHGRRILVDLAVDKSTADTLKVERDEDGKPIGQKIGKDRRNVYLKGEGRVENANDGGIDGDAWENLTESDQQKRGRAHQEKHTKLRSPLFFINPFRLSIRNLSKSLDESNLKELVVKGIKQGLRNELVTKDDLIAHWRAGGELTPREILDKVAKGDQSGNLIPSFDEKKGIKHYIPSVFIDRDFGPDGKGHKHTAPSRGFGFVEFTHHVHALACLRELNNNTSYSSEYVAGGKKAMSLKRNKKKKGRNTSKNVEHDDFIGEDGQVRIPRLVVEFTVENKAKARKQAERKAQQQANIAKQKAELKEIKKTETREELKKRKKSRGAQQRERKRKLREKEGNVEADKPIIERVNKKQKSEGNEEVIKRHRDEKAVKPSKKKKKDQVEEKVFEDMVRSYKETFAGGITEDKGTETIERNGLRKDVSKKRWFD